MIPKIIHYCWLSNDPVPEELKNYMCSWGKKLPDYDFIKWDFNRFQKESSIWVTQAFDNKKYAFAADYIRLYAIYNYGGIYMDMDIEVLKSFNDLLHKPYMMAYERPKLPWIEAGCFGAEKNDKFIGKCLDYYKERCFIKSDGTFDQVPLPQVMNSVMQNENLNYEIYPWQYFTAKSYDTGIEHPTNITYTIHHFAGSWKTETEKIEIDKTRKLSRIIGVKLAHNLVELKYNICTDGLKGIKKFLNSKRNNRSLEIKKND